MTTATQPGISTLSNEEREARMRAKLEKGETIESPDEMSDEYREHLVNLMTQQADSELAGGYGYIPFISKAPDVKEKLAVANIVKDEIRHAKAMYGLLEDLGIDVDERVNAYDFELRVNEADLGTERASSDKRVNIFYYPIETWTDFIMFNFCMDRAAGHQLHDVVEASYGPWRREMQRIMKEEVTHLRHGEMWVERLAQDPATKQETQETFNKWYIRCMNIFGRPGTAKNQRYRELGLKTRDNDEVRAGYRDEVTNLVTQWGMTVPEWQPNY